MKTILYRSVLSLLLGSGLLAQAPQKPPSSPSSPIVAASALTSEEKLQIRDLQVKLADVQRFLDVEIPKAKANAETQSKDLISEINKLIDSLVRAHHAEGMSLKPDLTWAPPQASQASPPPLAPPGKESK